MGHRLYGHFIDLQGAAQVLPFVCSERRSAVHLSAQLSR